MSKAVVGNQYEHYKGKKYTVLNIAIHSETLEELIIYKAEYDSEEFGNNSIWARPRDMFEGTIELNGKRVDRFSKID